MEGPSRRPTVAGGWGFAAQEVKDLGKKHVKAVFLNGIYETISQIEKMETAIQFKRADKVRYTPLNKEIKIANIYSNQINDEIALGLNTIKRKAP